MTDLATLSSAAFVPSQSNNISTLATELHTRSNRSHQSGGESGPGAGAGTSTGVAGNQGRANTEGGNSSNRGRGRRSGRGGTGGGRGNRGGNRGGGRSGEESARRNDPAGVTDETSSTASDSQPKRGGGRGRGGGGTGGSGADGINRGGRGGGGRSGGRGRNNRRGGGLSGDSNRTGQSSESQQAQSSLPDRPLPPHLAGGDSSRQGSTSGGAASGGPGPSSRRQRFNTSLTTSADNHAPGASSSSSNRHPAPPPPDPNSSLLVLLSHSLTYPPHPECPICFNPVRPRESIHSCKTCFKVFHLKCIQAWAHRNIAEAEEKASLLRTRAEQERQLQRNRGVGGGHDDPHAQDGSVVWRCPSCRSVHEGRAEIPNHYACFCGKIQSPPNQTANGIVAHSCGQRCGKRNKGTGCEIHPCPVDCHPGPCLPCNVMISPTCHCGSKTLYFKCSAPSTSTSASSDPLSCGEICSKFLACGIHRCQKTCHSGDCETCEVVRTKTCYCGSTQKVEPCAEGITKLGRQACFSPSSTSTFEGEFTCDNPCPWDYECGKHSCQSKCHPHTSSVPEICPRSPPMVTTCPCSHQIPLETFSATTRTSCEDAIPTCSNVCQKPLPECGHPCQRKCHEGECFRPELGEECKEEVKMVCRCGDLKLIKSCAKARKTREATQSIPLNGRDGSKTPTSPDDIICTKVCKALRSCGKHECLRVCCPLAFKEGMKKGKKKPLGQFGGTTADQDDPLGLHICDRVCGKKLSCGNHTCELPDHRGPCPRCLRSSFDELVCHCGGTVLMPPIQCGTVIRCDLPCARPSPPCGHPKTAHACHQDPECPSCPFLTTKPCQCWKRTEIKNVRCSQERISCGTVCGRHLSCGGHPCPKSCHSGDCGTCSQVCGKPRKYCGHPCTSPCHAPFPCPAKDTCPAPVIVTCACGNIKQKVPCSSSDGNPPGNRARQLKCNDACAVAQRNASLAAALGVDPMHSNATAREVTYSDEILDFYGENKAFAEHIEKTLREFTTSEKQVHNFPHQKSHQREFVHVLATLYEVETHSIDEEPYRSVVLSRTPSSFIPENTLITAFNARRKASAPGGSALTLASLRKPASTPKPKPNVLFLEAVFGHDAESLTNLLQPHAGGYSLILGWVGDEDVVCRPANNPPDLERTLSSLQFTFSRFNTSQRFCSDIKAAVVDDAGKVIWKDGWTSVSSKQPKPTTTNKWDTPLRGPVPTANSFAAFDHRPSVPQRTGTPQSIQSRDIHAVGGGFYKPPLAVIAPGRPPSRPPTPKKQDVEPVLDDWEELAG